MSSPEIDSARRTRTSGPRLVERVVPVKPNPGRRVKQTAAVTPAAYKDLTHKTPEAALFARLKRTASKQGSTGVATDVSKSLGSVSVAKMAAAARKAAVEAELLRTVSAAHVKKVEGMGGSMGRANPFARAHL